MVLITPDNKANAGAHPGREANMSSQVVTLWSFQNYKLPYRGAYLPPPPQKKKKKSFEKNQNRKLNPQMPGEQSMAKILEER